MGTKISQLRRRGSRLTDAEARAEGQSGTFVGSGGAWRSGGLGESAARELGEEAACRTSGENRRREEGCRHRASDSAGPKLNVSADGGKGWREMAREPS